MNIASNNLRENVAGIGFALPYLLISGGFLFGPLLLGLYMSFHDWNQANMAQSEFIGLQHYQTLISDPGFWNALWNTVYFVILNVPAVVILGFLLALGVNRNVKGRWLLRTIFFSPFVLTVAVVGLLWTDLFGASGLIPQHTSFITSESWLFSHSLAMPAIAITTIWWTVGFNFIILLAGRQGVSDRLYEAAKLDGASNWRMMKDITIPQMKNPLIFAFITSLVSSFQIFGQPYTMTQGGPGSETITIVYYLYLEAFSARSLGYAAAIGYVLFLIIACFSAISVYIIGGDE